MQHWERTSHTHGKRTHPSPSVESVSSTMLMRYNIAIMLCSQQYVDSSYNCNSLRRVSLCGVETSRQLFIGFKVYDIMPLPITFFWIDGLKLGSKILAASFGTTKYCTNFLRNVTWWVRIACYTNLSHLLAHPLVKIRTACIYMKLKMIRLHTRKRTCSLENITQRSIAPRQSLIDIHA